MMRMFEELGASIDRDWRRSRYDDSVFPEVAANQLIASQTLLRLDLDGLLSWITSDDFQHVRQSLHEFGQPSINVYVNERFFIEVLFWLDGSPAIHEHAFVGAFGVLAGSSVQSQYRFEPRRELSREMVLGHIQFVSSELLRRGAVRLITPGRSLIHSLFHLERPSLSLVIRTEKRKHLQPQYCYTKPCLAIDPFYEPESLLTQLRVLESLKRTNRPLFWEAASNLIGHSPEWMMYMVFSSAYNGSQDEAEWKHLLARAEAKHGSLVEELVPCLEERQRETQIVARRHKVHDPVYRFFLALLLNVPDQSSIYRLINECFPETDPEQLVLRWLREMAEKDLLELDFSPLSLHLLECTLHHLDFTSAKASASRNFSLPNNPEENRQLLSLWNKILTEPLLRPLFNPGNTPPMP
jgi:hypothetical protein